MESNQSRRNTPDNSPLGSAAAKPRRREEPDSAEGEKLSPLEAALVRELGKLGDRLEERMTRLETVFRWGIASVVGGLLTLVIILVFGLLATRGVDPRAIAAATSTVTSTVTTPAGSPTVTTTTAGGAQ